MAASLDVPPSACVFYRRSWHSSAGCYDNRQTPAVLQGQQMEDRAMEGPPALRCGSADDREVLEAYASGAAEMVPAISDRLRVGFCRSDAASQTQASEIVPLRELSAATSNLAEELALLGGELRRQQVALRAQHEQQLQQQAQQLHQSMRDALQALEAAHCQRLRAVRGSCRQQLCDALAVLRAQYERYYSGLAEGAHGDLPDSAETLAARLQHVRNTLRLREEQISALEAQLLEYEEAEPAKQVVYEPEDDPEKEGLLQENSELRQEVNILQRDMEVVQEKLASQAQQHQALEAEARRLREKVALDQRSMDKLAATLEKTKTELEKEKYSSAERLHQQREEMEKTLNKKIKATEEEMRSSKDIEAKKQASEKEKQVLLLEKHQLLLLQQKQQQQQQAVTADHQEMIEERTHMVAQIQKLQKTVEDQRKTIQSLKKQLEQNSRAWEKKFGILRQSMHAIKDEMFLRQSLQRQAVSLHRVSVNYAVNGPMHSAHGFGHIDEMRNNFSFPALPLPHIGSQSIHQMERTEVDIDMATGSHRYSLNEDELQIVSDAEEDLDAIPLLPSPPPRRHGPGSPEHPFIQA